MFVTDRGKAGEEGNQSRGVGGRGKDSWAREVGSKEMGGGEEFVIALYLSHTACTLFSLNLKKYLLKIR